MYVVAIGREFRSTYVYTYVYVSLEGQARASFILTMPVAPALLHNRLPDDRREPGLERSASKADDMGISPSISDDNIDGLKSADLDQVNLAEMGYKQDMKRNFSVISVLGVGFSLTNSWFGISAALITGINSGGPVLIVYGIILIALISTCVGISLSELASAYPNAGGQYFWANELAPRRFANFASYLTGWFAWAGSIFTSASVALAVGSAGVGCWQLSHPNLYANNPRPVEYPILLI